MYKHQGHSTSFAALAVAALLLFASSGKYAFGDNVFNDIAVTSSTKTVNQGSSTTVKYYVIHNSSGGLQGCDPADGSTATVTISVPAGSNIIANPSAFTFAACDNTTTTAVLEGSQSVLFSTSASTPVSSSGYAITIAVADSQGNYNVNNAKFTLIVNSPPPLDTTAPVITPNVVGTLGNNGWYTSDVTVSWTITDAESSITSSSGCVPTTINTNTAGTTLTCAATSAGGSSSQSVTIKRDATAPTIGGSATPAPNADGWNNAAVTVSFACSDAISGIVSCTVPQPVGEGSGHSVTGTAVDNAGNSATATVSGIDVDLTLPGIAAASAPAANANGWNNGDVTVTFLCTDSLSGIKTCTSPITLENEGAGQSATGIAVDNADNSASVTVSGINVDKTAPTISGSATPSPNGNVWNKTPVNVHFTCGDALSGVASCPSDTLLSSEGAGQSASATAYDKAGNSATTTAEDINIDLTSPAINISLDPATPDGTNGWYVSPVTVHFACSDALSGLASACPADVILSGDGSGQSVSGTITDAAGNSASASVTGINIDLTAPEITGSKAPEPNNDGWNNGDVIVSFVCIDEESGIASCTSDITESAEEAGQSVTGTAVDNAGNTVSTTVSDINIDKTMPSIAGSVSPSANANNWHKTDVTVSFACEDVLAGIRSCTLPVTLSAEGEDQSVTGTAEDKADNTASVTVGNISIDKTAPTITASRTPVANSYGWNNGAVEVSFICDDALSGVDSCIGFTTFDDEGAGQTVTGIVTDKANNSASKTVGGINIDLTAPTITHTITPAANSNGWHNADVNVRFEASDTLSGINGASTQNILLTLEGPGQTTGDIAFTDKAGNSASDSMSGISIDKTAPSVSIAGISTGTEFTWGDSIPAATCNATDDLSGMDTCVLTTVPSNGNVGVHTISATATDKAGNVATTSISYTIKAWTLRGFYQPVDMGSVLNTIKGGQTVPMKFELFAGTVEKTGTSDISSFTQKKISCSSVSTALTDDVEITNTGNTSLRYDSTSGQFIANWKTPTGQTGTCWEAKMTSIDGSTIAGFFKLK